MNEESRERAKTPLDIMNKQMSGHATSGLGKKPTQHGGDYEEEKDSKLDYSTNLVIDVDNTYKGMNSDLDDGFDSNPHARSGS